MKPIQNKSEKFTQELWWSRLLRPLLASDLGRSERSKMISEMSARTDLTDWQGRPIVLARSIIYRRLKDLKESGLGVQARKARADRGGNRCFISRKYDKAVPFDEETLLEIRHNLIQEIRGLTKAGTVFNQIRFFAKQYLIQETQSRGFTSKEGVLRIRAQ